MVYKHVKVWRREHLPLALLTPSDHFDKISVKTTLIRLFGYFFNLSANTLADVFLIFLSHVKSEFLKRESQCNCSDSQFSPSKIDKSLSNPYF